MDFLDLSGYDMLSFEEIFTKIANDIINRGILKINGEEYIVCEIEFYLSIENHIDPFIHGDKEQATIGNWYFHRQNGGSYKGGSFKGLDLTFGSSKKQSYGGILFRSIKEVHTGKILEGPCRIVDYILTKCGKSTIVDLVKDDLCKLLCFTMGNVRNEKVYKCPRVGLTLKNGTKEKEKYLMKNYRYLIHPNKIQKYKFGMILNLYKNGTSCKDIASILETSLKNIEKYVGVYETTISKKDKINVKDYYKKKLSTSELCELYSIL